MAEHPQARYLIRDALLVAQLLRNVVEASNATNKVITQLKACTWSASAVERERTVHGPKNDGPGYSRDKTRDNGGST